MTNRQGNLELDVNKLLEHKLIPGVYFGYCQFEEPFKFEFLKQHKDKVITIQG